jgi:ABC transport system ATP-binding/permease protein
MANVLNVQDLQKSYGTRTLFDGASFAIDEGEKVGIVGVNGSGKSTLLRISAGVEGFEDGSLALKRGARVGYLSQEPEFEAEETIRVAAAGGNPELRAALEEYHRLSHELGAQDAERRLARHGELAARIEALGGWEIEHRAEAILTRLGVDSLDRTMGGLSGGERKRVALARVLVDRPELLLLDEPTNHLDADTTAWLEDHLLEYPGAVLLITHDRYFLDRVVSRMLEVEGGRLNSFPGGYTEYLEAKAERTERLSVEQAKRVRLIEQELAWVKRSPAARTGKQEARIKRLGALRAEQVEKRLPEREVADLRFGEPPRLGRTVLEIEGLTKSYGDRTLVRDLSVRLKAGERVGVIGPNGAGKTTLMRIVLGLEPADAGSVRLGENTRVAYYDQRRDELDPESTVLTAVSDAEWVVLGRERIHIRSYLERFLFPTATHEQRVRSLSGGERSRLILARLFLREANLLILDEPTNDLDLVTLQVLESVIVEYPGCVLIVTHDRFFLDKIATALLVFEAGGVVHRHEGGYDLYRRLREQSESSRVEGGKQRKSAPAAAQRPAPQRPAGPRRLTYQEQRELAGLEDRILSAEATRAELAERLADPSLYAETPEQVARVTEAFRAAESEVDRLYTRWAELEEIRSGG